MYEFAERDAARLEASRPFLPPGSRGIEIGAGAYPSILPDGVEALHFDKRDRAGLLQSRPPMTS